MPSTRYKIGRQEGQAFRLRLPEGSAIYIRVARCREDAVFLEVENDDGLDLAVQTWDQGTVEEVRPLARL
jgi:hypothetical protein